MIRDFLFFIICLCEANLALNLAEAISTKIEIASSPCHEKFLYDRTPRKDNIEGLGYNLFDLNRLFPSFLPSCIGKNGVLAD
jgi:hypothetical protein